MIQKSISDYYEQLYKEFPHIPKSDIKRICQFGWKQLYLHNSYGCDVVLQRNKFWLYCGKLMKNSLKFFKYYKNKLRNKLRILYKRNKLQWDGYYYFALTSDQYLQYKAQQNKRGRPKKIFTFKNIRLFKIKDECLLIDSGKTAIFRIYFISDLGFDKFIPELKTDKFEFVEELAPRTMHDLLVSNYQYLV